MGKQARVAVVGSFNYDLVAKTPRIPVKGETILGGPFFMGPGGKGANQAVAAARLGAAVDMVVKLGQDLFGDQAVENLVREGVGSDFVIRTDESHTGTALIMVDAEGDNIIVVAAGANNLLRPEDLEEARSAITGADALLVQLEVPMETVERAMQIAHDAGVRVLLNPAPGRELDPNWFRWVDVLTPNETETQLITGMPVRDAESAKAAALKLLGLGAGAVVVTMGATGALVVTSGGAELVPGRKVKVVDTTGAGDAFSGALAVALAEGADLAAAVAFANAAAALQVTKLGTAPAMPYRADVDAFVQA